MKVLVIGSGGREQALGWTAAPVRDGVRRLLRARENGRESGGKRVWWPADVKSVESLVAVSERSVLT